MTAARSDPRRRVPRQERARETVERILAAARRLLEQEGPAALNTNRVAREAGVGVGSVYEYFADKTEVAARLIEALQDEEAARVLERIEQVREAEPLEAIRAIVEVCVELYERNQRLYQALRVMTGIARESALLPGERPILAAVQEFLAQHEDRLDVDDCGRASQMAFHIVEALSARIAPDRTLGWSKRVKVDEITRAVCRYLGLPSQ